MSKSEDTPTAERPITTHAGGRLDESKDFFALPPEEIGVIVSADSTLKKDAKPWSGGTRFLLACLGALLGGAAGYAIGQIWTGAMRPLIEVVAPPGLAGLGALIAWAFTRFKHTCSYVGKEGVVKFTCVGNRDNVTQDKLFLYQDAADLRTSQVRRFVNGVYQGTHYTYTWTDAAGQQQYKVTGMFRSKQGTPPAKDPYYFASAAENAWSVYLLDHLQKELEEHGSVQFNLGGRDWVRVGPGFVELNLKGQAERCEVSDIAGVTIANGVFKVKRKDAQVGWFSSRGVFQFTYQSMANARLFLLALDRLAGLRFK